MRTITLALLLAPPLAGCMHHHPTVPASELSGVPPPVIEQTRALQDREHELDQQIAQARVTLQGAEDRVQNQQHRIKSQRAAQASDLDLKQLAVERGDVEAARSADQRVEARNQQIQQVDKDLQSAEIHRDRSAANLELLERERDLTDAKLQLARAKGIASQGPYDTSKYEDAVQEAQQKRDQAAQRVKELPPEPSGPGSPNDVPPR